MCAQVWEKERECRRERERERERITLLACFSAERDIVHERVWSSAANSINSEDYLNFNDSMVETRDHDAAVKCLKFFQSFF